MKSYWFAVGLLSLAATAQQASAPGLLVRNGPPWSPAEPRIFTSAKEIEERLVKADASVQAGKVYDGGPLLMQGPHRIQMEWRNAPQLNTNLHETDAELFVVIEGSGTMMLGGTLINPRRTPGNAWEGPTQVATGATGGVAYKISKGDMIMIPENTAHTVSEVNGRLVLWALHLPGPAPRSPAEPARATATVGPSAASAPGTAPTR
jgi:mannose-6-phosphate isomerase-like protein (cupin superfamily)